MPTRRALLSAGLTASLGGCVTRDGSSAFSSERPDPNTGGDAGTSPSTTIAAGGGSALSESDLSIARRRLINEINQRREQTDGSPPLNTDGSLAQKLNSWAEDHTDKMHAEGKVAIDLEASDLLRRITESNCTLRNDDVLKTYEGAEVVFVDSIDTRGLTINGIASRLVSSWLENQDQRGVLLSDTADYLGVGVALRGSTLLVTVIFC